MEDCRLMPDRSCPGVADADNSDGYTPLHCAAIGGHAGCVDALLAAKADTAAVASNDRYSTVLSGQSCKSFCAVSLPVGIPPWPLDMHTTERCGQPEWLSGCL